MNLLTQIPPAARHVVYALYALVGLVLGALQVAYLAASMGEPSWLLIAFAVFGFLGTATGSTAKANTPKTTVPAKGEGGYLSLSCRCNDGEHVLGTALWHRAYCNWYGHDRAGHRRRAAAWGKIADSLARFA